MYTMLSVKLQGGLGNWLFQLAAGQSIAKQTGRTFFISDSVDRSPHSNEDYFTNILRKFAHLYTCVNYSSITQYSEPSLQYTDWNSLLHSEQPAYCLIGYFQDYHYVSDEFVQSLVFDTTVSDKYPKLDTSAFIHIRGTDYKNNRIHDVHLASYYERSVHTFPAETHFYIFTNDEDYANSLPFVKTISHTFVRDNEIDSLYLMSRCAVGGICANSSYSWWGAFLNPARTIVMPDTWYADSNFYTEGYYFPNVVRISTAPDWSFIDKVVYINLDQRPDRDAHMKRMTRCFSDNVIRFSAIQDTPGSVGCSKSHIAVLEMAINHKWKNILILEDDAVWNKVEQGYASLRNLASTDYDVIVLGGTFVNRDANKLRSCKTTVGYLVNSTYYSTLLANFKEGLESLIQTNNHETSAVDTYWNKLQATDNWFIVAPCLVYQRPDYSDICHGFQDYRSLFQLD